MTTYEVVNLVEMTVTHKIKAASSDEANDIASERTQRLCSSIIRRFKSVTFGEIVDDYVPANETLS